MSSRENYSAQEWEILSALPSQVAIAAAVSDGVSVTGTMREFHEGDQAIEEGASTHPDNALIASILEDMAEQARELEEAERMVAEGGAPPPFEDVDELPLEATEPMTETTTDFAEEVVTTTSAADAVMAVGAPDVDPRDAQHFLYEVIANARQAREILASKSTPEEIGSYNAWVLEIVDRVIERTRSGGFLGIGGKRVDEEEAAFRAALAEALGA
jgi:hypothetical protein